MKNLLIVGARGFGREIFSHIQSTQEFKDGLIRVKGFLDSKSDALNGLRGEFPPILDSVENYKIQENDIFFIAMGDSKWRKYYADIINNKGGKFHTIILPESKVFDNVQIGEGSFISRWCTISDNVSIGKHVIIQSFTVIGHDAVVADYCTLLNSSFMGGYSEIGECSQLSPKSMIIPHKKVGKNVVVGAASVVMTKVKDNCTVFGNPAKKIEF